MTGKMLHRLVNQKNLNTKKQTTEVSELTTSKAKIAKR